MPLLSDDFVTYTHFMPLLRRTASELRRLCASGAMLRRLPLRADDIYSPALLNLPPADECRLCPLRSKDDADA